MAEPAVAWSQDLHDADFHSDTVTGSEAPGSPLVSTLLNLVQMVQEHASSDEEVVAVIVHLLLTRRVVLGGIFAGKQVEITL